MTYPFHRQPLKALYITYTVLSVVFVRLPYWSIRYILPLARPRRNWTFTRSLIVSAIQVFSSTLEATIAWRDTITTADSLAKSADKYGLVWIDAAPQLVRGEIKEFAEINNVAAVPVAGYWYGQRDSNRKVGQKAGAGEKVLYELHSGGWVAGDASPKGPSACLCTETMKHLPEITRAFAIEYRLAQGPPLAPEGAFPAAIIDAAAGYHYLVHTLGFAPADILLSGESCGGTLAVALVRHLLALALAPPGALLLVSPTADWGTSTRGPRSSFAAHDRSDFAHAVFTGYVHHALLGALPADAAETNAWISPGSRSIPAAQAAGLFAGFPPTFIQAGGAEMTLDGMLVLRDRLKADTGDRVAYLEVPDGTHMVMGWAWHEPEKTECYEKFAKWYRALADDQL